MCPLWPLHIILLYILCVLPMYLMAQQIPASMNGLPKKLSVAFSPEFSEKIVEGETKKVEFRIANLEDYFHDSYLEVELTDSDPNIATIDTATSFIIGDTDFVPNSNWSADFNLTGRFLGYAQVAVKLWSRASNETDEAKELLAESEPSRVAVIRAKRAVDKAFVIVIAILVSIAFVNMGCTLDMVIVKETLKKPVGPLIGFCCQYLFMPLCAFGLAKSLLSHNVALQLGLFVTGCSPGGGGSNMWTLILGGNLHLSITMTCLSTIAAFAMMPMWTMTLGRLIFTEGKIAVPYRNITTGAIGLAVPLLVGLVIRRYLPKVACVLAKTLKPIAGIFLLIIITFGIFANLYIFQLMDTWVLLSSSLLVLLGYTFGGVAATILRQPWPDALAIAIETGLQNTGIAVFILRITLDQPDADINTVIPVAVALMTPVPLFLLWIIQKLVLQRYGFCLPISERKQCPVIAESDPNPTIKKLLPDESRDIKIKELPATVKVVAENC